jgi:two-component system, cell cycle sensor histidine kinase and response regulator CckA
MTPCRACSRCFGGSSARTSNWAGIPATNCGRSGSLGWNPGYGLWKVKIDPSQVDQLLANLSVNARDAIEKTGRIVIATSNEECDEKYCSGRPECIPGEYVILAVSDDGCGMAKETMENIFEPFFTTKQEGQGTGLGLATVYGIVKQNRGFIDVYSEPGQGTTFRIHLPRHGTGVPQAAEDKADRVLRGGTETVLLVEDEEAVLKLAKSMLEKLGYRVLSARKTEEAIRLAGERAEVIDLLLTDVVMPDMNGKELLDKIRTISPGLKCLFMSGYTADVISRQGVLDEGVRFIAKPFSLMALDAKVRSSLDE